MGKIAEWIWPELVEQKKHITMLEAGIEVLKERNSVLASDLALMTMELQKTKRELVSHIRPHTPEVLKGKTSAEIRRMTEKVGDFDGV